MKQFFAALLILITMQAAFADDTANIKIKITGASSDNHYLLCEPNIGCLSIYNAVRKNRVYPVYHSIEMDKIFVTNTIDMSLSPQGLPKSCDVTVETNKTITIYGNLVAGRNNNVRINNLHCTVA